MRMKATRSILLQGALLWGFAGCASSPSTTSSPIVGPAATTTTLSSSVSSVATGVNVTLTATVSPNPGNGTVTFYDGTAAIGTGNLSNGTATLTTTFATGATHMLAATFAGSAGYVPSTSSAISLVVTGPSGSAGPATYVYVLQYPFVGNSQVLQFTAGANGSVAPVAILAPSPGFDINSIATDSTGQLYIAGYLGTGAPVIEIFDTAATGTPTPTRTIALSNGRAPSGIAVSSSGSLYTVDFVDGITVYSSTANGMAMPARVIAGALTGLAAPVSIAVDSAGNIYVAENSIPPALPSILVFSPTASGNVAPSRTITNVNAVTEVAVDANGNLYAIVNTTTMPSSGSIVEYASGASGAAVPIRTIAGTATGLSAPYGLCIDGAGNIFVANPTTSGTSISYSLDEFAPTATGNVAPVAELMSTSWTNGGGQIALK